MENHIETTTNKWFEETVSKVNDKVNSDTPADNLLSGIVPVAHNYCNAVFLLANANHKLPAMALLRILGELALRTIWCMYKDNPRKESHDVRILRWLKTTNDEEIKLLKKVLPSANPEDAADIRRTIVYLEGEIARIRIRSWAHSTTHLTNYLLHIKKTSIPSYTEHLIVPYIPT